MNMPSTMRAVAIEQFGGEDTLRVREVDVPELAPDEILIRIEAAGVGDWDVFEREGGFAKMMNAKPTFPYVLGSEGAGVVARLGERVRGYEVGDRVYAAGFLNPKGGFYAEYAAVPADFVLPIPDPMSVTDAAGMCGVALTALRGLDDMLHVQPGESVLVFGASGGIGHTAVQLAKLMKARVLAVASGKDGVALADELGADASVDGHGENVLERAKAFAPDGFDAILLTAGGEAASSLLGLLSSTGRATFPAGVEPRPLPPPRVNLTSYEGNPDKDLFARFQRLTRHRPLAMHVAQTFSLGDVAKAHRALTRHYCGKLVLRVS